MAKKEWYICRGDGRMKEYIEREALKADLQESYEGLKNIYKVLKHDEERRIAEAQLAVITEAILRVKEAPAGDVVEVVRCKDCKYCIPATADGAEYELCIVDNDVFPVSVQKQHFCSRGKRKEE